MVDHKQQLSRLISPRSVAVIGASRNETRVGARLLHNIIRGKFSGKLYPVNPQTKELLGLKCYPLASAIGSPVDLALITVPMTAVEDVIADCIKAEVHSAVIITAGFAEASVLGAACQERIRSSARSAGMRLVGPNCLGLVNTDPCVSLNAIFAPQSALAGNVAIASQSGAVGLMLLDYLSNRNVGISSFVSIGNRSDVSSNDLLEYWEQDDQTRVIALYLESIGNPERFLEIARRVSKRKPIIALKAGRSQSGKRAAASHSAAVASDIRAVKALFQKAGVITASTTEELIDLAAFLSTSAPPSGPGIGILSNGGGPAILLADVLEESGLTVPRLSKPVQERLRIFLPAGAAIENPVDMLPHASGADYANALAALAEDPQINSIAVMHIPVDETSLVQTVQSLPAGRLEVNGKVILPVFMSSTVPGEQERIALPHWSFPENIATILAKTHRYRRWKEMRSEAPYELPPALGNQLRKEALRSAHAQSTSWIPYDTVCRMLRQTGLLTPHGIVVRDEIPAAEVAQLGYPVVAKILAPGLIHKQDIGGVHIGIQSLPQLEAALGDLRKCAETHAIADAQFLIQPQFPHAVEAFIGAVRDPEVGPVVVFGLGGKLVQLLDDVRVVIPPLTENEIEEALAELRLDTLLRGFRGDAPADRAAFIAAVRHIGALMCTVPEIMELDLNPIMVLPQGCGAAVADARIRVLIGEKE